MILSFMTAFAQTGSEIYLFDVNMKAKGITLSSGKNITNHAGYDNQPFFYGADIYFSSANSGQMDIKKYNYKTGITTAVTNTIDNEFSPTVTPDEKFISCILQRKNGKQDLVKYPIGGGVPEIVIDDLTVGYHTWAGNDHLLLFILEDTNRFGLHYYNIKTREDKTIATDIGRSLHKIPGKNSLSFIQKSASGWMIREFDPASGKVTDIVAALPNHDLITWSSSYEILMSDGDVIYYNRPATNSGWHKVIIENSSLKNITRMAFSGDNKKLAVVVAE
jgi:hypothetical protein